MLQEKQIEIIRGNVMAAKNQITAGLVKDIDNGKHSNIKDSVNEISVLNKILELLGYQKHTETETHKKHIYHLGDDMKGMRPMNVVIHDSKYPVASFRDVSKVICEHFAEKNSKDFAALEKDDSLNGKNQKYFSENKDAVSEATEIKFGKNGVYYVDIGKISTNNMLVLRKVLKTLGVNSKDIKIEMDPKYKRKPRTANGTES